MLQVFNLELKTFLKFKKLKCEVSLDHVSFLMITLDQTRSFDPSVLTYVTVH